MGFSSRRWAAIISHVASRIYVCIIVSQIPLFGFPCRIGVCHCPVEITACQMIASGYFPDIIVHILLSPKAIIKSVSYGKSIPGHDQTIKSYKSALREAPPMSDLRHLEVIVGSYMCVAGTLLGMLTHGRMSLFGLLLIVFGIARENFTRKQNTIEDIGIYPEMILAIFVAFCSVRRDVRKLIKCCKPKRLKNCTKRAK